MKFPRNARIFRGRLDAAPYATVFFLLAMFLLLSSLLYTPGVHIQLPVAGDLPGTDKPTVAVAIAANGWLYYQNQLIEEPKLKQRLSQAARESKAMGGVWMGVVVVKRAKSRSEAVKS